jgi:mevalonate kinase
MRGGVILGQRLEDGGLEVERLELPVANLDGFEVFHTGRPRETTGEVVASVRRRRVRERPRFEAIFQSMGALVERFKAEIERSPPGRRELLSLVRSYQRHLEEIGVVPESTARLVKRIEAEGGAAKISGAGALTGTATGSLLVLPAEGSEAGLRDLEQLEVELGAQGLRIEES